MSILCPLCHSDHLVVSNGSYTCVDCANNFGQIITYTRGAMYQYHGDKNIQDHEVYEKYLGNRTIFSFNEIFPENRKKAITLKNQTMIAWGPEIQKMIILNNMIKTTFEMLNISTAATNYELKQECLSILWNIIKKISMTGHKYAEFLTAVISYVLDNHNIKRSEEEIIKILYPEYKNDRIKSIRKLKLLFMKPVKYSSQNIIKRMIYLYFLNNKYFSSMPLVDNVYQKFLKIKHFNGINKVNIIAATLIYYIAKKAKINLTQRVISKEFKITDPTLRTMYKYFKQFLDK